MPTSQPQRDRGRAGDRAQNQGQQSHLVPQQNRGRTATRPQNGQQSANPPARRRATTTGAAVPQNTDDVEWRQKRATNGRFAEGVDQIQRSSSASHVSRPSNVAASQVAPTSSSARKRPASAAPRADTRAPTKKSTAPAQSAKRAKSVATNQVNAKKARASSSNANNRSGASGSGAVAKGGATATIDRPAASASSKTDRRANNTASLSRRAPATPATSGTGASTSQRKSQAASSATKRSHPNKKGNKSPRPTKKQRKAAERLASSGSEHSSAPEDSDEEEPQRASNAAKRSKAAARRRAANVHSIESGESTDEDTPPTQGPSNALRRRSTAAAAKVASGSGTSAAERRSRRDFVSHNVAALPSSSRSHSTQPARAKAVPKNPGRSLSPPVSSPGTSPVDPQRRKSAVTPQMGATSPSKSSPLKKITEKASAAAEKKEEERKNTRRGVKCRTITIEDIEEVLPIMTVSGGRKVKHRYEKANGLHYPGKVYKLKPENPNAVQITAMVNQIETGDRQHPSMWAAKLKKVLKVKKLRLDLIVGCTDPGVSWYSNSIRVKVLMVFESLPRGVWVEVTSADQMKHPLLKEFFNVQKAVDQVIKAEKKECKARKKIFEGNAHRYLEEPKDTEFFGTSDLIVLRTKQQARAFDLRSMCARDNTAPLYCLDHTGELRDFKASSYNKFEFTNYPVLSRRVQKALEKDGRIVPRTVKCGANCPCNNPNVPGKCECTADDEEDGAMHECTSMCGCDPQKCGNRIVQNGRQHPLFLKLHTVKGWTVRLFENAKKGDFINEYVAQLVTQIENKNMGSQTYSMDQGESMFNTERPENHEDKHPDRKNNDEDSVFYCHRCLVANSLIFGNEGRFSAHACVPNLKTRNVHTDPRSAGLHRTGFFAERGLRAGSEITWSYHSDDIKEAMRLRLGYKSNLLDDCDCGAKRCPIHKAFLKPGCKMYVRGMNKSNEGKSSKAKGKRVKRMKREEKDDEMIDTDYDSLPDSDEEKEQEQKTNYTAEQRAAKREQKRNEFLEQLEKEERKKRRAQKRKAETENRRPSPSLPPRRRAI